MDPATLTTIYTALGGAGALAGIAAAVKLAIKAWYSGKKENKQEGKADKTQIIGIYKSLYEESQSKLESMEPRLQALSDRANANENANIELKADIKMFKKETDLLRADLARHKKMLDERENVIKTLKAKLAAR